MKIARVWPNLVRGAAAFALVGAVLGVAAQSASASSPARPHPIAHLYVNAVGHTNTGADSKCGSETPGGAAYTCQTISYAVSLADAEIGSTLYASAVIKVAAGTYYDTTNNAKCLPSGTRLSAGIDITESNITLEGTGAFNALNPGVKIAPCSTQAETSVEDTTQQNVLINVAPGTTATKLQKLGISGTDAQNSFTAGSQDFLGVYFGDSSGTLHDVTVTGVTQPAGSFGDQPGANGDVYAVSCASSCPNSAPYGVGTSAVTLTDVDLPGPNTVTWPPSSTWPTETPALTSANEYGSYDKNGITCDGANTTCTISGTTVTGLGSTNINGQNGMQIAYGAKASITGGSVEQNQYNCNNVANGYCYSATGILPYADGGVTVSGATVENNDVDIAPVLDSGFTVTSSTIDNAGCTDGDVGSCVGVETVEAASATIGGATSALGNHIETNVNGGVFDYASTGTDIANNTLSGDSGTETICTVTYPCPGTPPAVVGGGVIDYGSTAETVAANSISSNAAGGVVMQGATGGTVGPNNTISSNAAGGVLVQESFGVSITGNTVDNDAAGGVVSEDPPYNEPASPPCSLNATESGNASSEPDSLCQNTGNSVTGNTFGVSGSGTEGSGVELELTGGFTIESNTVSGLGLNGEGILLVGSDNNTVGASGEGNKVATSAAGIVVTGTDLTGPSVNSTVSNNDFNGNLLGGAAADGYGSPESWNRPGEASQGTQGEVFFQSSVDVAAGAITSSCPDTNPAMTDYCVEVVNPAGIRESLAGAYEGVAQYLAAAGAICDSSNPADGGIPVDQDGYYALPGPTYVPNVVACTDGTGDIFLATPFTAYGAPGVATAITHGNGNATGPTTGEEPGCESSPPPTSGASSCTGSVLSLSALPYIQTVAEDNTFNANTWNGEAIGGAIDGSGPNAEQYPGPSYAAYGADPSITNIQNIWTNNIGDVGSGSGPSNPTTANPVTQP